MEHIGFNAWFRLSSTASALDLVHGAMTRSGLKTRARRPPMLGDSIRYGTAKLPAVLPVTVAEDGPWAEVILFPITAQALHAFGQGQLATVLYGISAQLDVVIGRTWDESLHGAVRRQEVECGRPEWLDWFQYWSAAVVGELGIDRVRAGPFRSVTVGNSGSCAFTLYDGPDGCDQISPTRAAASYLGLALREWPGRNFA